MTPHDSSRVPGNPETAPSHKSAWGKCGATDCYPLSDLFEPRFRPVTGSVRLSDLDNLYTPERDAVVRVSKGSTVPRSVDAFPRYFASYVWTARCWICDGVLKFVAREREGRFPLGSFPVWK